MNIENQNMEWKESWRDEYIKWVCGFANAQDPISYKGQYHYRSGSTKQILKGAFLDKFLLKKQGKKWDNVPVPNAHINDLQDTTFDLFRAKASKSGRVHENVLEKNNEILLENLRLKEDDYLKRAAILLFHPDPEFYFTGAYIKIGFFQSDAELVYQDEIHGTLFEQSEKTMDLLLTKYLKAYISYDGITRIERFLFPREALREALLNAIVHKDYSCGVPIQIKVYENKIIFWNKGYLPENWTIEHLKQQHPSNPYNPDIANAFFRAGLIESWGRGIEKMETECRKHGIPAPEFKYLPSNFMIEMNATDTIEKSHSEKLGEKLGENRIAILKSMRENPKVSISVLSKKIRISTTAIEQNIKYLKENHFIQRKGPAKGGHWEILKRKQ